MTMQIASAAEVADRLGVRLHPGRWTPTRPYCHASQSGRSLGFRDPKQAGWSLDVICWGTCDRTKARHTFQDAIGLPICRCDTCWERSPGRRDTPLPRPVTQAVPPKAPPRTDPAPLWQAGQPIPQGDHPARRWLAYRHLWHEALDLPPTVRWLARDRLPWSWKKTEATGAIITRLDPFQPPGPTAIPAAVQLIYVDGAGTPVTAYAGEQGNKRTLGVAKGAVGIVGRMEQATGVNVVEGLADALAVASRQPWPVLFAAGVTGPRWNTDLPQWLVSLGIPVHAWTDPGSPGEEAMLVLTRRVAVLGGKAAIVRPGADLDPGAAGAALPAIDAEDLREYVEDLQREGLPQWEAARRAAAVLL